MTGKGMIMKRFNIVGKHVPRNDAHAKARGSALYTDDMKLPGMLYGRILRSPLAHARIVHIDTSQGGLASRGEMRDHRGRHTQDQVRQLAALS